MPLLKHLAFALAVAVAWVGLNLSDLPGWLWVTALPFVIYSALDIAERLWPEHPRDPIVRRSPSRGKDN